MANTFNCPTCGAPLTYKYGDGATIACPFCRSSVIVPAELRQSQQSAFARPGLDEIIITQVRDLLARNKKIDAVKLVRLHTDLGLKEALDLINAIEAGR